MPANSSPVQRPPTFSTPIANLFGGVPFLDDTLQPRALLTAVAVSRRETLRRLQPAHPWLTRPVGEFLDPVVARAVREEEGITAALAGPSLPPPQQLQVTQALQRITTHMPSWAPLFALPLCFRALPSNDVIGCSCYAHPQHIYLSDAAFASAAELEEQVIHETCHNWMYFLEEMWRLHAAEHAVTYTLPSGTAQRNVTEVLGAAHVTASLHRWYRQATARAPAAEHPPRRREEVLRYLQGCLALLAELPPSAWTPAGAEVYVRLRAAAVVPA